MNSNYLTTQDKSTLLSKVWENIIFSQGELARVFLQFVLLICFVLSGVAAHAAPAITNTATANFTINGNNINLNDSVTFVKDTVVVPTDTLELEKSASVTNALIGDTISYTLKVTNPNPRTLSNVTIEDNLPTGLIYQTNSATINNVAINANNVNTTNNDLTISLGSMPANSEMNITYQANISQNTPGGDAVNKAIASSDTATSLQVQANVVVSQPIVVLPLILDKTVNVQDVKIGDTVSYTLTISNNNNYIVSDASVKDFLPNGLAYIAGTAKLDGVTVSVNVASELTFDVNDLAANSTSILIYDVTVNSLTNNSRLLVNSASVIVADSQANSNTATASVTLVDDTLSITKTTTATDVLAGDVVDYSITLNNPLSRDLSNLIIKDILPTGFIYQFDSAKVNNVPLVSSDVLVNGNNVDFNIGTLSASASLILNYKVTINENALPGENINTAQAVSDFASSLTTTAKVKVRTPSTINFLKISNSGVSSLIQPTSFNTNQQGGKNFEAINSVTLPDGSIISLPVPQPIIDASQYNAGEAVVIEVIDLDQNLDSTKLDTIEVTVNIPGTNDTEILLLTETSINSGVFRGLVLTTTNNTQVQNGVLTVADGVSINVSYRDEGDSTDISATAALIVPNTSLQIEKTSDKEFSAIGELVRYSIQFRNTTGFELGSAQLNDLLPVGFRYIANTAQLNGNQIDNGISFNGRTLTFTLNNMPANSVWVIEYVTKISAGVQFGDAINTAYITSGSLRSNDAQAVVTVKDDLMSSTNLLTGRVYIGCKTNSGKDEPKPEVLGEARIYMETGRSVLTDKEGFWHMEGVYPGAHVLQLDTESIPGYEPMLCNDNTRRAREAKSHFVDLQAGNIWNVDFHVKPIKGYIAIEKTIRKDNKAINPSDIFDEKYLAEANDSFEILWPKNNYVPAVASTKIFIKHSPQQKVEVFLNGSPVSALNYDGSDTNKDRSATIKRWLGVDIDIKKKNNTLLAILKDKSGKEVSRKTHNIHFSSNPASAKMLEDQSILVADGKTHPVITIQVKDEDGFPMRANTHGYFTIESNQYTVKTKNTDDSTVGELNQDISGTYKYEIGENGIAHIELNPTTQSGHVKLILQFTDSDSNTKRSDTEISAWLKPALREWIMVGIAEGTLAHNKLSGNMQSLNDLDKSDDFSKRGRVAFFAKGQVKGKYLLTVAYDTHKNDREVGSQLNGNIDPDAFYTIYADNSNSQYEAPSSEKLYLKLEKDNFYALFGDYQTDMTITELAKYQRTLNGIKTEYRGKRVNFKGFISETSNNNHHEEIPGDGTSGLYQLSNKIIPNSETIVIETRNRFRSDEITLRRELVRYQDYNIDYDSGSLFFKFPITSRDEEFNPNIIVIDYDSEENTNKSITAGGRLAIKSKDGKLETGLSFIHEGNSDLEDNQLIAVDATYQITPDTEIHVEVAQSTTEESDFEKRKAYIIELEKEIEGMEASIYFKKQESGFGINSQASENGIEKVGAQLDYKINKDTQLNSEVSVERNLENNNKRRVAQVEVVRQYKQYEMTIGYRHTGEDILDDNNVVQEIENNVVLLGGQYTTRNDKVTLRTDIEKNISSSNGSELSPDRIIIGTDVKIGKGFSVFVEHETTKSSDVKTHNNRVGLSKDLWKGAKARTTYTQERTDQSQRNYATLGLSQTVKLNDKISADFTVDQAKTISSKQLTFNEDELEQSGSISDDYTAFSVGLGSNDEDWSWTSRAEYRNGEITDKINFLASVIRHYDNGKNLSAKLSYYNSDNENGDYDKSTTLSFGSAWHPKEEDFVFFSRLDLVSEDVSSSIVDSVNAFDSASNTTTQKVIHNMHYNRKINKKTQIGLHHGIKHVIDENNGVKSSSTIDTGTVELRRDINKRWDIGVHGGYLRDWNSDATEYVAGVSVGVNPKKNIWVELGYNVEGFNDSDFDNNNYTAKGVYIDFRYKFNQDSFKGDLHERRNKK